MNALLRHTAVAALAMAPVFAHAGPVERCINTFAAQNFPNSRVTFVVEGESAMRFPLVFNNGTFQVRVVASSADGGRVLASATCSVNSTAVTVGEISVSPLTER